MATKKTAASKKAASKKVGTVMHVDKVTNPKQAIAIGLSEARAEGDYVKPQLTAKKEAGAKTTKRKRKPS